MSEITCEVIPLYRYEIYYESKDDPYDFIIVSNTIKGLVDGIVDRELDHSFKDCRKYLTIQDFLFMPCEDALTGYHVFDIDSHDIQLGNTYDEEWYDLRFEGKPNPVTGITGIYKEFVGKMDAIHQDPPCTERFFTSDCDGILADALYEISQPAMREEKFKQISHENAEYIDAMDAIGDMKEQTG